MDFFKITRELLAEVNKFIHDVLLFYLDGNKYFEKIIHENFIANAYRLIIYIAFFIIIQTYFLSENPTFDYSLIANARLLLFQLPIMSLGYLIAMLFSNFGNKIKVCLNYVVFQQTITGSIPLLMLSAFIHTESYFFYFLYEVSIIVFIFFLVGKFVLLFFQSRLKQVLSGLTIVATGIVLVFMVSYFDINIHIPKHILMAFEDPIASEFYTLECFNETNNANAIVNSAHSKYKQIEEPVNSILSYIKSEPSISSEAEFFLATNRIQQLLYMWKLDKEKENSKVGKNIDKLEKKLNQSMFNKNRYFLHKNIETYTQYNDFLDDYDKTLTIISSLDYENLSITKRKSLEAPTSDATKVMQLVRKIVINEHQIDIHELKIKMNNDFSKMLDSHIEVTNATFSYLDFLKKIEKYLPVHYYKILPYPNN